MRSIGSLLQVPGLSASIRSCGIARGKGINAYEVRSKSSQTFPVSNELRAGQPCPCNRNKQKSVTSQHATWRYAVNMRNCASRVFVRMSTCSFRITAWTSNLSREQTPNFLSNLVNISATETLEMLRQVYDKEAMSRARCFEWHSLFVSGRTSLNDDERYGRLSMSSIPENVEDIGRIVRQDRRITINEGSDCQCRVQQHRSEACERAHTAQTS